jgi:paraquat-inducible protein B
LSYVWIVPLIAAVVAGYLFYKSELDVGPSITITFENGINIAGGSKLVYRGVAVGEVKGVALDPGLGHVNVQARLDKPASELAREGSQFWIVEPRVSVDEITGLGALLSGLTFRSRPAAGPRRSDSSVCRRLRSCRRASGRCPWSWRVTTRACWMSAIR